MVNSQRMWGVLLILALVLVSVPAFAVHAQGGTTRQLAVGDVVTGTLDSQDFIQVYSLAGSAGDTITIDVTTETTDLNPVLVVTDQRGSVVSRDVDLSTPDQAILTDLVLPSSGTFYISVMRGTGAEGDVSGTFTLRLAGFQQIGGELANLQSGGITFELGWEAAVNMNIEVRDPVGGTVHAFSPGSPSGGTLAADVNANCASATATNPTETVAWPAGQVPAGSYEVIIYYIDGCGIGGSQQFTLSTTVDGQAGNDITGTLLPNQGYLSRLELNADGTWQLVNGGVNAGLDVSLFNAEVANASPIVVGSTVSGVITNESPAKAYRFEGTANNNISISMQAQSGSLDTYLVLLDPDNTPLVSNDDFDENSTNAGLTRTLTTSGTYTLLATRYGLTIGGTEGEYTLTLTTDTQASTGIPTGDEGVGDVSTPVVSTTDANLTDGSIEVKLTWLTLADMQLLVRDPSGYSVFDDIPTIPSGGILEADGNVGCLEPTNNPVSYIYWPAGRRPAGTYEIEVWYQATCDDPTPVNFGLEVTVDNQTVINTTQSSTEGSHYMITFTIQPDGTVVAGPGGGFQMDNPNSLNYQAEKPNAIPVNYQQTVSGTITSQQRFVLYTFEGQIGDIVTIGMNATSGTLDPSLYLISPDDIVVSYNDDIAFGDNADSAIDSVTLPSTGSYYIIATHYGLDVGGTEGTFNLTLFQD